MEQHIIMAEDSKYWGSARWQVIEVNERGSLPGPIHSWEPGDTVERALSNYKLMIDDRPWNSEPRPGRTRILVLTTNTGPTERWLTSSWYGATP